MTQWFKQRHAPLPGTYLCQKTDIETYKVKEFPFGGASPFAFRMFIYNDNGTFKAYRNSCPHYDVPLNHSADDLFTSDKQYFQCMTHFAKFEKDSGACISGPCEGKALESIPIQQDDEALLINRNAY
ncbi:Rieske 2Fe-2S domain-containing protein [Gammaproteobacteria bacterium]|nr:Rieske 2Fe-2S domain-containing protein [Gammaproteobacteria bacterium]